MRTSLAALITDEFGYAKSGELDIAYAACGSGSLDILHLGSQLSSFEALIEEPGRSRYVEPLTRVGRVIAFDRRGVGVSQRSPGAVPLEDQVADVLAVLDATASTQAAVVGYGDGAMLAVLFAATHPERISHLMLMHGQARITKADGYEWAMSKAERHARLVRSVKEDWGKGGHAVQLLAATWAAADPRVFAMAGRWERLLGTPSEIETHLEVVGEMDVRRILPQVQAPTLVIDRPQATAFDSRHARYLTDHIPGARLCELPGRDALIFADGVEATVDAIGRFVSGNRSRPEPSRALSTVVFTDVVDSTARAAAMGDSAWRRLLIRCEEMSRDCFGHFHGRPIKSTGDGFLATFDGPAKAVRSAAALTREVRGLGLEIRTGVHTGEIEILEDDVAGIAVHVGARIGALAGPGEVLVSSTVRDLVAGSEIDFEEVGSHALKGIPRDWHLFRAIVPSSDEVRSVRLP